MLDDCIYIMNDKLQEILEKKIDATFDKIDEMSDCQILYISEKQYLSTKNMLEIKSMRLSL